MVYGNSAVIRWNESSRFSRGWFSLSPRQTGRASVVASLPAPSFILKAPSANLRRAVSATTHAEEAPRAAAGASVSVVQNLLDSGRGMVARLCEVGSFMRRLRAQLRFGDLSRAPLQLLRLEVQVDSAECEWMARPADQWDVELNSGIAERNASTQALADAIQIRELLFLALPNVPSAVLRAYAAPANRAPRLIIAGTVMREQIVPASIRSLAMRAKLFGLHFRLNEGVLEPLPSDEGREARQESQLIRTQKNGFAAQAAMEGGPRPLV